MPCMRGIAERVLERLLDGLPAVSATQLAQAAGISRQAAHKHLRREVDAGRLVASGKARACRYRRVTTQSNVEPRPLRTQLDVASAGSTYRLSARLLMDGVTAGEAVLDFTGVYDVGEEFLDELFLVWAPKHPHVTLKVAHFPSKYAALLFGLAKRDAQAARARVG